MLALSHQLKAQYLPAKLVAVIFDTQSNRSLERVINYCLMGGQLEKGN